MFLTSLLYNLDVDFLIALIEFVLPLRIPQGF